jgi:hypothetical protein
MQLKIFFSEIKNVSHLLTTLCFLLLSIQANAQESNYCPKLDSPDSVALKFQLFSAYQTGYDGYEAPCELKCMGNLNCQKKCQSEKALDFLAKQMKDIKNKKNIKECATLTLLCVEQCQPQEKQCAQVCDGTDQRGLASTKTF